MKPFDYLIVGAGLFGAVFANRARAAGKTCLVIDKRPHIGGNIYTEVVEGIDVHRYGAHIFHTNNEALWKFVTSFGDFNNYVNSPVANYKGRLFNLPFNMNTFYAMWGVTTPRQAQEKCIVPKIRTANLSRTTDNPSSERLPWAVRISVVRPSISLIRLRISVVRPWLVKRGSISNFRPPVPHSRLSVFVDRLFISPVRTLISILRSFVSNCRPSVSGARLTISGFRTSLSVIPRWLPA